MRIQNLYYKLGGKRRFPSNQVEWIYTKKTVKRNRKLLQDKGICALDAMSAACKEAGVSFGMEFGTLLGAYRNQGFIPYDDDMDLTMWAEDCSRDFENVLLKYGFYKKELSIL
ncbi:LicD family protein [Phocaeicola vulgatus]|nr:LicD family protein [Phocaeicola vulgatus]